MVVSVKLFSEVLVCTVRDWRSNCLNIANEALSVKTSSSAAANGPWNSSTAFGRRPLPQGMSRLPDFTANFLYLNRSLNPYGWRFPQCVFLSLYLRKNSEFSRVVWLWQTFDVFMGALLVFITVSAGGTELSVYSCFCLLSEWLFEWTKENTSFIAIIYKRFSVLCLLWFSVAICFMFMQVKK